VERIGLVVGVPVRSQLQWCSSWCIRCSAVGNSRGEEWAVGWLSGTSGWIHELSWVPDKVEGKAVVGALCSLARAAV
jgi:hypothetical protein